jgi:hypothetical protein
MSLKARSEKVEKDIQKRTIHIAPTKVNTELIQELGEFLENQEDMNLILTYSVDSETKEVTKQKVKDFVKSDWGEGIRKIAINSKTAVRIKMDFVDPQFSEYTVYGRNLTWVNGTTKCIGEIFHKYKLRYASIKTNWFLKFFLVILLDTVLCYPIFLVLSSFYPSSIGLIFFPFVLFAWGLISLISWLFPYFEYGEPLQKSMRKWIWFVLFGSGLAPSIILKFLGL